MKKPIGYISYTHGLDGKVKIVPMVSQNEFENFIKNSDIFLSTKQEIKISISAFNGKVFLCKIEGFEDIDKAKTLLKKEIFVNIIEEDGYIDAETLIGFEVLSNKNDKLYGKVVDCGDYGAGMLIEVELFFDKNITKRKKINEFYLCDKNNIIDIDYDNKQLTLKVREEI